MIGKTKGQRSGFANKSAALTIAIGLSGAAAFAHNSDQIFSLADAKPRLIVTGLNKEGRSTFVFDGVPEGAMDIGAGILVPLWQVDRIPQPAMADSGKIDLSKSPPPPNGLRVYTVYVRPDASFGSEEERRRRFNEGLKAAGQSKAYREGPPGMHQTDSAEVLTVISGEITSIMETGEEKVLKPGDSLVQRGTNHAWSNRGKIPARIVYTMWSATR